MIAQLPGIAAVTVTFAVTDVAESVTHGPDETWYGAFAGSSDVIITTAVCPTDGNVIGPVCTP